MDTDKRVLWIAGGLVVACGFIILVGFLTFGLRALNTPATTPTIDLFATLAASSPVPGVPLTPFSPTNYPTVAVSTYAPTVG